MLLTELKDGVDNLEMFRNNSEEPGENKVLKCRLERVNHGDKKGFESFLPRLVNVIG